LPTTDPPTAPAPAAPGTPTHPVLRFDELNLPLPVMAGVAKAGFHTCTPVQAETLPLALAGRDVMGQAQTGTGKTAAFLITIFTRLLGRPRAHQGETPAPRSVIIAPTRELVVQIERDASVLGGATGLGRLVVFGGLDYDKQRRALGENPDLLVGTPGRLIDYFRQGCYSLKAVEILVIDEADRMFDMGFIDDIRFMLRRMPPPGERQTMLFSATFPQRVKELAYEHMHETAEVAINPEQVTAERITETLYLCGNHEKFNLLVGVLRGIIGGKTMVFVNTKRTGEDLEYWLEANGIDASFISGDVPQKKRLKLIDQFKSGELPILIATDVASRGLHIDDVSHIINYDVPQDAEDYVHRVGRTARAGAAGEAIILGCETYSAYIPAVEEYIGRKLPIEHPDDDLFAEVVQPYRRRRRPERPGARPSGERSGRRPAGAGTGRRRPPAEARSEAPQRPAAPPPSAAAAGAGPNPGAGEGKKKRRRRRRRRPGGAGAGSAPTPEG
jgi:ATP-dependent RNA helicase RhlB